MIIVETYDCDLEKLDALYKSLKIQSKIIQI
jgi:hypothetical protein